MKKHRWLIAVLLVCPAACPREKADEELTIVVREDSERIAKEKTRLDEERKEIDKRKEAISEMLKNTSGVDADLGRRLQQCYEARDSDNKKLEAMLEKEKQLIAAGAAGGAKGAGTGPATAEVQRLREGQSQIRTEIGEVKGSLSRIDGQLTELAAKLDKMPSAPIIVNRGGDSDSPVVKRKTVERNYTNTKRMLTQKGLMMSDLPPDVQGHNAFISRAIKEGDYASANLYVDQLRAAIEGVKIDRAFVKAKMDRLRQLHEENPPDKSTKPDIDRRFNLMTKLFSDGKFGQANAQINEMMRLLNSKKS